MGIKTNKVEVVEEILVSGQSIADPSGNLKASNYLCVGTTTLPATAGDIAAGLTGGGQFLYDQSANTIEMRDGSGGTLTFSVSGDTPSVQSHSLDLSLITVTSGSIVLDPIDLIKVDATISSLANDGASGITIGAAGTGPGEGATLRLGSFNSTQKTYLTPQAGDLLYDSTAGEIQGYFGGTWNSWGGGGGGGTLNDLTDVNLTSEADFNYLSYDNGNSEFINKSALHIRHTGLAGNFSSRVTGTDYHAAYFSNEANIATELFINVAEFTTPNHLSATAGNGQGGPRISFTSFGGTGCGYIAGRRTGSSSGDLLFSGGSTPNYCFSVRRNYTSQNFALADSGVIGISDTGNTNDLGNSTIDSNTVCKLFIKDGNLYFRNTAGTVVSLTGGAATSTTLNAASSGATFDVENNVVVIGVPASGSTAITVPTPFVAGNVNDVRVTVSSALGTGGGLTGFQCGDGSDPDRWGEATTVTLNTNVFRNDWTVLTERASGFYVTLAESSTLDFVITPIGGDWDGGEITLVLFVHNTTAFSY